MQVYFHTLGCKVNRYETEQIKKQLENSGFSVCALPEEADLIVVNSCTVTAESDRKTRQLVRRYRSKNEGAAILLTGCMPQAFPEQAKSLPADIILGNGNERNVISAVNEFFETGQRVIKINPHKKGERFDSETLNTFEERTRAYMKIEDGCDRGCTYCIIPRARGRVRSRSIEQITAEAAALAKRGFREVVLVGINLSSFGKDIGITLADAVEAVAGVEAIRRIRLGSLEPDLTDNKLLDRLLKIEKFCPQFHLSLQSGCNNTLKRMNRLYTSGEYKSLVKNIRLRWQDATVTTDIMVGFAGETLQDFNDSLEFAKEIGFLKAHIFPYSVRNSTAAAGFENMVPEKEKERRASIMARECKNISKEILEGYANKNLEVLFETTEGNYAVGYSKGYVKVYAEVGPQVLKTIRSVKVKCIFKDGVLAEI